MLTSSLPSPPSPSSSSKRKVDEISKEEDAEELPLASSKVPVVVLPVVPPKDEKQPDEQQQQQQQDQDKKEDDEEVVAAAAEQAAEEVAKAVNDDDEDNEALTPSGKRRFFPRVKHLLAIEWEPFLNGVLDAMEKSGAPTSAAASHKLSNPWYKGFDMVYNGVAVDCSVPHGKNRYHKFKDKIVELWVAMEQHAPDDHPEKKRALDQLEEYRKACANQSNAASSTTPKKHDGTTTPAKGSGGTLGLLLGSNNNNRSPLDKTPSSKRSYASSMALKWRHLNEWSALGELPQPLQSLVHLRHLTAELGTPKQNVEEKYQSALEEYLKEGTEGKDALYAKSLGLAVLFRLAQSAKETKELTEAYDHTLQEYLVQIDPNATTV